MKNHKRKRTSSVAVETVLGTEESYASNVEIIEEEHNESKLPLTILKSAHNVMGGVEP